MNFSRGDTVVHPSFGVGTVVAIEEMAFAGEGARLFYRVDFGVTTIWVPLELQQPSSRLRPVTPKADLGRFRTLLNSPPELLDNDFRKRQVELVNRLGLGTFQALCEVVRDLSARNRLKSLGNSESTLLNRTRQALIQEWAAASEKYQADAEGEIDALLIERRPSLPVI
jgi:RNA polymerase-interacting CarD/CdnL/TRCF family regulator